MLNFLNPIWLIENFFTCYWFSSDTPAPQNTTVQNTNIPEYAQPYVTNMLEATQRQLFNMDKSGNITGFNKYNPYSTDPTKYVAGFSPMQQQAMRSAQNMQVPGQFGQGSTLAGMSGMGSYGMANQMANAGNQYAQQATNPNSVQQYMNPYLQNSLAPQLEEMRRQYGITGTQQQSDATRQGAFGGSREALMASENNRNMNTGMNQALTQGYNNAFNQAQQAQQFGAGLNMQGMQGALQGYGQANQAAGMLGQLGTGQYNAEQGILGLQNQFGQQQQQNQQNIINQGVQNYANEQQYPMMQLGMMSNMLRGLPMQGLTTQSYTAQPSMFQQTAGLMGAMGSGNQYSTSTPRKAGGILEAEPQRFDVGGAVKGNIAKLPTDKLNDLMKSTSSDIVKGDIRAELALRNTGAAQDFAKGGILSFTEGGNYDEAWRRRNMELGGVDPMVDQPASSAAGRALGLSDDYAIKKERELDRLRFLPGAGLFHATTPNERQAYAERDKLINEFAAGKYDPTGKPLVPTVGTVTDKAKPAVAKEEAMKGNPDKVVDTKDKVTKLSADDTLKGNPKSILSADSSEPTMKSMSADYLKTLGTEDQALLTDPLGAMSKVKSVAQTIRDQQALEDEFMPKELKEARVQDRKNVMAEKANVADELKRREEIRNQNFWLRVGSTPGPIIATALKATMEKNAEELNDTAWGKKALKDANDLIAKLNDSDYMIAQGDIKEGMALHEKSVDRLHKVLENLTKGKESYLQTASSMYGHQVSRENNKAQVAAENRRTDVAKTSANNETTREDKNANDSYSKVLEAGTKLYKDDPDADKKISTYINKYIPPKHRKVLGLDDVAPDTSRGKVLSVNGKPI